MVFGRARARHLKKLATYGPVTGKKRCHRITSEPKAWRSSLHVDGNIIESHDLKPSIVTVKRAVRAKIWTEIDLCRGKERDDVVVVVLLDTRSGG